MEILFCGGDTHQKNSFSDLFSCIFTISEQQKIYSPPRPDLHQRRSSSTSSRNSNIASACWCVFSQVTFLLFGYVSALRSKSTCLFLCRPVWNQPSPILHQRSLFTMYSNLWIWWVRVVSSTSVEIGVDMWEYIQPRSISQKTSMENIMSRKDVKKKTIISFAFREGCSTVP